MTRQSVRSLSHDHNAELEPRATSLETPEAQATSAPHRFERGQTLVEYALIIALVAIVVIAALFLLGPAIASTFNNITHTI